MGKNDAGPTEAFEYIKCYWNYIDDRTPVLLFYEVDLKNERYATRMTEVFSDRRAVPVVEEGFPFITEAPVPSVEEINQEAEFSASNISKEEFEEVYHSSRYPGELHQRISRQNHIQDSRNRHTFQEDTENYERFGRDHKWD